MNSRAMPDGRRSLPTNRVLIPWVVVSLVVLQGCTQQESAQATAQGAAVARKGSRLTSALSAADIVRTAEGREYVRGQLLVRFRAGVAEQKVEALHAQQGAEVLHTYQTLEGLQVVQVAAESFDKALDGYRGNPQVVYAEPNYVVHKDENVPNATPNDPRYASGELWGLNNTGQSNGTADMDINAPEVWDLTTGSASAGVITVIDTGVDYTHPDMAANMWVNPGETPNNGVDDDNNGYVDDIHGINAITNTGNPLDDEGHGSHVAGTIAAAGNNTTGVVGVAWTARIMGCKFLSSTGSGTTADAIKCLDYVAMMRTRASNPINIIATNNSWGGGNFSTALGEVIARNRDAGILFVCSAGNSAANNDSTANYPSGYGLSNQIVVASHTRTGSLSSFSNFGRRSVHITAPGSDILSLQPGGGYVLLSGTSMASPHVSGVVALLNAQDPARDWRALKNLVMAGGKPHTPLATNTLSGRRLRAADTGGGGSLTCSNQTLATRVRPIATTLSIALGSSLPITYLNIDCATPAGAPAVTVTSGATTSPLAMLDDGTGGDEVAGDGLYTGSFSPTAAGTYSINLPGGETLTVTAEASYIQEAVPFAWRTITGTNLNLSDDGTASITSPFPIPFANGSGRTALRVGNNGAISFESSASIGLSNAALPVTSPATLVAPFWDDLYPNGTNPTDGNVFWAVTGTTPSRELVIEWRNVHHFQTSSRTPPNTLRFQVVFFEGSSDILFNYRDVSVGNATIDRGASATVGVQIKSTLATQYSFNSASLSDDSAILWYMLPPGSAPVVNDFTIANASINEGDDLTLSVDFSDADGDTDGPWKVEVDTNFAGSFTTDQTFTVGTQGLHELTLPMRSSGDVTVAVRVVDVRRARSGSRTAAVAVAEVPPALAALTPPATINELQATSFIASFTDPGTDGPWRVEWDFNYDGTTFDVDASTSAAAPGDSATSFTFPQDGTYTIAARVTDINNITTAVQSLEVQVADLRPQLAAITGNGTLREGQTLALTSSFADPGDSSKPWTVQWDFNYDGTTFTADKEDSTETAGDISLSELVRDSGAATWALRVVDNDGSVSDVQTISIIAAEVDPIIGAYVSRLVSNTNSEPAVVTFNVAALSGAEDASADETSVYLWDFDGDGDFDYASVLPFASYRYADSPPGGGDTYSARVRVMDEDTYTEATVAVTVRNAPPTVGALASLQLVEGTPVLVQASASDPGADTLTFSLQGAPGGMTITSGGLLSWTPMFGHSSGAGLAHTFSVVVTDDDGASASQQVTYTVRWRDEDADGMADTWERANGMDPTVNDADADSDGDGVSNLAEFLSANGGPVLPDAPEAQATADKVRATPFALTTRNVASAGSLTTVRYQFQVFADAALTHKVRDVVVDQAAAGDTTEATLTDGTEAEELEDLVDDHTYAWRVRASDGAMHGPWSALEHFTFDPLNDAPSAPRATQPMSGTQVSTRQPMLTVDNAMDVDDGSLTYVFEVAEDAAFSIGLQSSGREAAGNGRTSWLVAEALKPFITYYWRATVQDGRGGTNASEVSTFSVYVGRPMPAAPTLAEPANGSTVSSLTPTLAVTAATAVDGSALGYVLEVDTMATFGSSARQTSGALSSGANGRASWQPAALQENTRYYWRARAMDGQSASDWTVGSFFVDTSNEAPSAPVALNPSDAVVMRRMPTLTVLNSKDPEGDAVTYAFSVSSADGAVVASGEGVAAGADGTTSYTLTTELKEGVEYTWTATATDARGATSAASTAARFSVDGVGCSSLPGNAGGLLPVLATALGLLVRRRRQQ